MKQRGMNLFGELKRRNVFRVGIAYLLAAWVLLQVIDFVLDAISAPNWILQVFLLTAAVGFIAVLVFSWVFEMTPEGIKRESQIDRSQSITPQTGRKLDRVIIGFLALAVVVLLTDRFWDRPDSPTEPVGGRSAADPGHRPQFNTDSSARSVAVLPFVNMSDDAGNEYFSDGISEELLNVLVRVEGLRVPSRTSSFSFKGSDKKIDEIGKELQVDHVLEGSVRKAGNRIRVTAQLIDVNTDTHLWSETYTREVDDIFAVQDEIAQAIVDALKLTLSGTERGSLAQHSTDNVEAYNKYLLGRHLWNQRSTESLIAAVEPLMAAVAIDPQFDQAWAALADAYVLIPEYRGGSIAEFVPKAKDAAGRALEINPDSARALTTRGYIRAMYDYDFSGANADFARAIELEPGYATGHQWYAEILAAQGLIDEALEQADLAIQADPRSAIVAHVKGWILMYTDRQDEAIAQFQTARTIDPQLFAAVANLETLHLMRGEFAEARLLSIELGGLGAAGFDAEADLAMIDGMENPTLKPTAAELLLKSPLLFDGTAERALSLALLGESDLALDNLEKAFAEGDPYAIHMKRISLYDPLRENPRFKTLLAKMNLGP